MVATLTNITFSSVQVNWDPVPGVHNFTLYTLINGAIDRTFTSNYNNNNSYTLTGLGYNQTYSDIYIEGISSSNNSIGSIQATGGFTTLQKPILTQSVVNGQITINWTSFVASPSGTDNYTVHIDNRPYAGHTLSFNIPVGNALSYSIPANTNTPFGNTNTPAGFYDVNVIFNFNAAISSDKITVEIPFFISPSGITSTSAILTWNLIEIVSTYSIVLSLQGTNVNTISGLTGNTTTIPNLIPNRTYQVDIFCYYSGSPPIQMPYTATNVFTTLDAPQTNTLSVSNNNTYAPTLTWTAPPGNYQVQLNGQLFATTNNINSLTLSNVVVGNYTAQILAGNGYPASNIVDVYVTTAPVDCVGWFDTSDCDNSCMQTYHISTPALNGGQQCPFADNEQIACETISCTGCNAPNFGGCPDGFVCDTSTAKCEPKPVCHTDADCDGLYCNTLTGDCENNPINCNSVGCTDGLVCDEDTGKCVEPIPGCTYDSDCTPGQVCNDDGECVDGSGCTDDNDCVAGQVCNDDGQCVDPSGCTYDSDCTTGQLCNDTGECVDGPSGCTDDNDCNSDQVCNKDTGDCIAVGHDCNDAGCPENQTCNSSTGRCEKIKGTSYLWVLFITIPVFILLIWFLIKQLNQ